METVQGWGEARCVFVGVCVRAHTCVLQLCLMLFFSRFYQITSKHFPPPGACSRENGVEMILACVTNGFLRKQSAAPLCSFLPTLVLVRCVCVLGGWMGLINREVYPAATSVSAKHHFSCMLPHLWLSLMSYLPPHSKKATHTHTHRYTLWTYLFIPGIQKCVNMSLHFRKCSLSLLCSHLNLHTLHSPDVMLLLLI